MHKLIRTFLLFYIRRLEWLWNQSLGLYILWDVYVADMSLTVNNCERFQFVNDITIYRDYKVKDFVQATNHLQCELCHLLKSSEEKNLVFKGTLMQIWKSASIFVFIWKEYLEDFTLNYILLFEICACEKCEKFVYKHSETIEYAKN